MSFQLMGWAVEQHVGSPTGKAVLLSVANAANHHTGKCCPSVEAIARETEFSEPTVKRALTTLVEKGFLARTRPRRPDGTRGTYRYTFPHLGFEQQKPALSLEVEVETENQGSEQYLEGSESVSVGHQGSERSLKNLEDLSSLEAPLEQPLKAKATTQTIQLESEVKSAPHTREIGAIATNGTQALALNGSSNGTKSPAQSDLVPLRGEVTAVTSELGKLDRKPVKPQHEALARQVLAAWNEQTSQHLTSKEWLCMIVMRIREHPELAPDDHAHVISATLAEPWWQGPPTLNVIYGKGTTFERAIERARSGPSLPRAKPEAMRYGRGVTTAQLTQLADKLRAEGR